MRKPELRNTSNGTPVTDFSCATTERWKSKTGEEKAETEWHKVVVWGRLAESVVKSINKGDLVYIEGKITYRPFVKDDVQTMVTEIEATNVLRMDSKAFRNSDEAKEQV